MIGPNFILMAALILIGIGMAGKFGPAGGLAGSIGLGGVSCLALVLTQLLEGVPLELSDPVTPRSTLARDRLVTLKLAFAIGAAIALAIGLGVAALGLLNLHGLLPGLAFGLLLGLLIGIALFATAGLIVIYAVKWPHFELARIFLALQGRLPWSLLDFLEDAHLRGVLRQAGAAYQFRHIELQHRLARRNSEELPESPSSATSGFG
jgi:hypothetical protein